MKIEDLIGLLNNRLNSFKLTRDYAVMSGNLESANDAEVEISDTQDTLYQLNLLVDASTAAIATDTNLVSAVSSSVGGIINGYDISSYATDPLHEKKIADILSYMGPMNSAADIDSYINKKSDGSPVTGSMILSAANASAVDARLMMAIMEQDSRFGTLGVAVRTLNPGNVGNNDAGDTVTYVSWAAGVNAVAQWLSRHRASNPVVSKPVVEETVAIKPTTPEIVTPTETATTTPEIITPTETATTTPEIVTPTETATTTPEIVTPTETATTTPEIVTSTDTATTTPGIVTPTETATTTLEFN